MEDTDPTRVRDSFLGAMAAMAGAVSIVATSEDAVPSGMVATAVCSLSAQPPSVVVCVNKDASSHDIILRQKVFSVSLPKADDTETVLRFATRKGAERFVADDWMAGATGAPLLRRARISLDCRLAMAHEGFSHSIFVGLVVGVQSAGDEAGPCLLWQERDFYVATQAAVC
ncbi:MAG TPA: flavin reductase family protein [Bordetella sp.]|jgi:flavin reductase|nr:flavin reductase family protein [Bordetella sp.]